MKKIISILAAGLLFTGVVSAQTPTGTQPASPSVNYNTTNPTNGMSQINTTAIPDPLRTTLQGNQQYKGWEGGQWYFNSTTNQYSVQMPAMQATPNPLGGAQSPVNPTGTANPTLPANPTGVAPIADPLASPTNPASANPLGGTQSPVVQQPATTTWYRFDQNGKLIPQTKPN